MIQFFVPGEPKSQPRPKAARIGGFIRIYTPSTAKAWKGAVAKAAAPFLRSKLSGPLALELCFRFARPKSHLKKDGSLTSSAPLYHTKKPDADNLAKAVMDALTDAGLWEDDDQVIRLLVEKHYTSDEHPKEGCVVTLHPRDVQ